MPRPTNIDSLFNAVNSAMADLSKNPEQVVNHLASIPGGIESLSPEILNEVYSYIHANKAEIRKAFADTTDGVFERRRKDDDPSGNAAGFIIKQDPFSNEFYLFISRKSKRIDGTKYADADDPTQRISYNQGQFSECKIAFEALGESIQPFVELVPKKNEDGERRSTTVNKFNKELGSARDAVTRSIEVVVHRNNETHVVKYAPYRPKTFLDIYNDPILTIEQRLEYFAKLLLSVDKLHKATLVHLDIKPDNVLIDEQGNVTLADLDTVAKIGTNIKTPNPVGTSIFMSPELIRDNIKRLSNEYDINYRELTASPIVKRDLAKSHASSVTTEDDFNLHEPLNVSEAQDIWSLGIILYEIIYGKRMDMTEIPVKNDWDNTNPYPETVGDMYIKMFNYCFSVGDEYDILTLHTATPKKLSEKLGNENGEIDKYKFLIDLADQMLNISPDARGSLQQIANNIMKFVNTKKNANTPQSRRQVIIDNTNPIVTLIKEKNKESWPDIKEELKQHLLSGTSEENQKIIESCFKQGDLVRIANLATDILNNPKKTTIISDEQASLRNRLTIIYKVSKYLQSSNSSWNFISNKNQAKKDLLVQILQHELILKTTKSNALEADKSFTKNFRTNLH